MSARTLRLLTAFGLLFAVFVYVLSVSLNSLLPVKSPEEGLLGGPVTGLTRWQLAKFEEGRSLFRKTFGLQDGLGPLYNESSCAECHGGLRTTGGAGETPSKTSITLIAKRKAKSSTPKGTANSDTQKFQPETLPLLPSKNSSAATPTGATQASITNLEKTKATAKTNAKLPSSSAQATNSAPTSKGLDMIAFNDLDSMENDGGPVLLHRSITDLPGLNLKPDCKLAPMTTPPKDADFHALRYASQLYGLGLVNTIPDSILALTASQQRQSHTEIHGKTVQGKALLSDWTFGRFGAKAQESSLMSYVAQEMCTELGISNQLCRHTLSPKGTDNIPACLKSVGPADPNDDGKLLQKIYFYLQTLAPPPRAAATTESLRGDYVFQQARCAVCHLPELVTPSKVLVLNPDGPWVTINELPAASKNSPPQLQLIGEPQYVEIRALENKPVRAYSDFLVHEMGPALADGIAQQGTTSGEWRTTPLWGLRHRQHYMHDGRAKTLEEAIALHAGEATDSVKAFAKLTEQEKKNLIAFLNSL